MTKQDWLFLVEIVRDRPSNGEPPKVDAKLEVICEPLQRVELTFQVGATSQHLRDAPVGDFDTCNAAPLKTISMTSRPSIALDRFEDLVARARSELLDAIDGRPITAPTPPWSAETKRFRKLLRERAEDLDQCRILCERVRMTLAQAVVLPIQASPNPQPAIAALPGTAAERIMGITRELFPAQYNGLRQLGLQQVAADTTL